MWHEARSNEKKIKELMVDHKKRAERRRAYYESRRGDPRQLLRVVGSAILLHPDAEQYYHHENTNNLMPWQGDPDIKIDRFDGRSLLEFVPDPKARDAKLQPAEDKEMSDDLNFERYHDLVEAERLRVSEHDRLAEVEEEWNQLLDRHKALLAMLTEKKSDKPQGFGYDYGTNTANDDVVIDQGPQLLKETDILKYVDELNDRDRQTLNDMAKKYGIRSYARLLRVAKKDRDDELRDLKKKDTTPREASQRSKDDKKRKKKSRRSSGPRGGRESPSYEPYSRAQSDSETSAEEDMAEPSDVVIEFGSETANINVPEIAPSKRPLEAHRPSPAPRVAEPTKPEEKKLTPMEKLKLKMRAGLEKQIQLDQCDIRRKRLEKEMEDYHFIYSGPMAGMSHPTQTLGSKANRQPEEPTRPLVAPPTKRYRSPSSSRSRSRSRSPTASAHHINQSKAHSTDRRNGRRSNRSPSPKGRHNYRSRSPSYSKGRSRRRSPSYSPTRRSRRRSISPPSSRRSRSRTRRSHQSRSPKRHRHEHRSRH
ncbi:alternative splicing regulator-domain-containing protein [Phycomyces nitens]|nr:alternative splicing regulator-domain-containing protein [Phycomyces nitens]